MGNSFLTYNDYRDKLDKDLDVFSQDFFTFDEKVTAFNEAVRAVESEITTIDEDYLVASYALTLVNGTAAYTLPTDIYINKIRAIIYQNGIDVYEIKRIKRTSRYLQVHMDRVFSTPDTYRYYLSNESTTAGCKIEFVPTPIAGGQFITVWHLRALAKVPLSADGSETASNATTVDVPPECSNFVIAFMKERVVAKEERGSPSHQAALRDLDKERQMMCDSLSNRVLDDPKIEQDHTYYREHS